MKTCPNCRCVWPDDYSGQCLDCGKGLGGVTGSTGGDLGFAFARQLQEARKEEQFEATLKGARSPRARLDVYNNASVRDEIVDKALEFVVQREEVKYEDS
jgi:hypothetical protein